MCPFCQNYKNCKCSRQGYSLKQRLMKSGQNSCKYYTKAMLIKWAISALFNSLIQELGRVIGILSSKITKVNVLLKGNNNSSQTKDKILGYTYIKVNNVSKLHFGNAVLYLVAQSCLTLCDPMNRSLPGSSVQGILQARILEWIALPSSRGSSQPGIKLRSPALQVDSLPSVTPGKPILAI